MNYSDDARRWLFENRSEEFWDIAGEKVESKDEYLERFDEIHEEFKFTAKILLNIQRVLHDEGFCDVNCRTFRHLIYYIFDEMIDDLPLPHYWYVDGIMIEPEIIVKITNGLIGFEGDESCGSCGRGYECRFYVGDNDD